MSIEIFELKNKDYEKGIKSVEKGQESLKDIRSKLSEMQIIIQKLLAENIETSKLEKLTKEYNLYRDKIFTHFSKEEMTVENVIDDSEDSFGFKDHFVTHQALDNDHLKNLIPPLSQDTTKFELNHFFKTLYQAKEEVNNYALSITNLKNILQLRVSHTAEQKKNFKAYSDAGLLSHISTDFAKFQINEAKLTIDSQKEVISVIKNVLYEAFQTSDIRKLDALERNYSHLIKAFDHIGYEGELARTNLVGNNPHDIQVRIPSGFGWDTTIHGLSSDSSSFSIDGQADFSSFSSFYKTASPIFEAEAKFKKLNNHFEAYNDSISNLDHYVDGIKQIKDHLATVKDKAGQLSSIEKSTFIVTKTILSLKTIENSIKQLQKILNKAKESSDASEVASLESIYEEARSDITSIAQHGGFFNVNLLSYRADDLVVNLSADGSSTYTISGMPSTSSSLDLNAAYDFTSPGNFYSREVEIQNALHMISFSQKKLLGDVHVLNILHNNEEGIKHIYDKAIINGDDKRSVYSPSFNANVVEIAEISLKSIDKFLVSMESVLSAVNKTTDSSLISNYEGLFNEYRSLISEVAGLSEFEGKNLLSYSSNDLVIKIGDHNISNITLSGFDSSASGLEIDYAYDLSSEDYLKKSSNEVKEAREEIKTNLQSLKAYQKLLNVLKTNTNVPLSQKELDILKKSSIIIEKINRSNFSANKVNLNGLKYNYGPLMKPQSIISKNSYELNQNNQILLASK